jgi:HEPN domain-containing protein
MLDTLNLLYIESRYPNDIGLLPNGKPTIDEAVTFLNFSKEIYSEAHSIINK